MNNIASIHHVNFVVSNAMQVSIILKLMIFNLVRQLFGIARVLDLKDLWQNAPKAQSHLDYEMETYV